MSVFVRMRVYQLPLWHQARSTNQLQHEQERRKVPCRLNFSEGYGGEATTLSGSKREYQLRWLLLALALGVGAADGSVQDLRLWSSQMGDVVRVGDGAGALKI